MAFIHDVRYAANGDHKLAVEFDGQTFTAYHVGSENVPVNVSMETIAGLYPEYQNESLLRVEDEKDAKSSNKWLLKASLNDHGRVANDEAQLTIADIQRKLTRRQETERDLIEVLEQSVEALDEIIRKPNKPTSWANTLLPILEGMVQENVDVNKVLDVLNRQVVRKMEPNEKDGSKKL